MIKKLCEAFGPSGREKEVRELIKGLIKDQCDELKVDALGNLIARKKPESDSKNPSKIMLCAHMDEIGVIITHIEKSGFLRFAPVGGVYPGQTLAQRVKFENGILGVIGVETKQGTPRPPRLDNMFIDIGARDREEAEKLVKIGDMATFHQVVEKINNRIMAKALDDRIGCYCLIETLRRVKNNKDDLYFVFSAQEEVGVRGARTGAFAIAPKYALAIDVTGTGDTPESPRMDVALGKGVAIKVKDRRFIAHQDIRNRLIQYAREIKVDYQLEVLEFGSTDASIIQIVREGARTGVLSIPTRYVHSTGEVCDINDVEQTIKLLVHTVENGFD